MIRTRRAVSALAAAALLPGAALAADIFVYPQQGQSAEQQARDQQECHSWAAGQTGFDPATTPPPSQQSSGYQEGGVVRGGARGAAVGAVVGAVAGNAGKGAAAGAAGGALIGGMRRRDHQAREQANYDQQVQAYNARHADWRRAMTACLQGRGYSVN